MKIERELYLYIQIAQSNFMLCSSSVVLRNVSFCMSYKGGYQIQSCDLFLPAHPVKEVISV